MDKMSYKADIQLSLQRKENEQMSQTTKKYLNH